MPCRALACWSGDRRVPAVELGRPCAPRARIRSPAGGTARLPRPGGRPAAFSGARHVTVQRARAVQSVRVLYDLAEAPAPAFVAGGAGVAVRAARAAGGGNGRQRLLRRPKGASELAARRSARKRADAASAAGLTRRR